MGCRLVSAEQLREPMLEWNIIDFTPRIKLYWDINRNSYIFINENAVENACKMVAISSRLQCIN